MIRTTLWSTEEFRRRGESVLRMLAEFVDASRAGHGPVVPIEDVGRLIQELRYNPSWESGLQTKMKNWW